MECIDFFALGEALADNDLHSCPDRATHGDIGTKHRHAGVAHTENKMCAVGVVIDLFIRTLKLRFT
jgi:hypothetical protein